MTFLTEEDIRVALRDSFYNEITDEDTDVIDIAEASAISKMKSMLRQRYDVTTVFSGRNYEDAPLIVEYCTAIFLHRLAARINPRKIPDNIKDAYMEALSWLEKVVNLEANPSLPEISNGTADSSDVLYYAPIEPRDHQY